VNGCNERNDWLNEEVVAMNAIEIKGLKKKFSGKDVLENVSLTVEQGDIYGFLGPNGAGKTTTLRIILGIISYEEGSISVIGKEISSWKNDLKSMVNVLPESHGFYEWMNAVSYLQFFGNLYGIRMTEDKCLNQLHIVGLDPDNHLPIRTYSRGMKQRLGIARATINSPEILFLDEPTNGLDPRGRREIHDFLLRLNREHGTTIVISTHILDDVERLCNRIAILHHGKIRYEGMLKNKANGTDCRYNFRLDKKWKIPDGWQNTHIKFLDYHGDHLICQINGITPTEAIKTLLETGLPVVEAEQISGGIEETYFVYTEGD